MFALRKTVRHIYSSLKPAMLTKKRVRPGCLGKGKEKKKEKTWSLALHIRTHEFFNLLLYIADSRRRPLRPKTISGNSPPRYCATA